MLRQTVYAGGGLWVFDRAGRLEAQAQARPRRGLPNAKMGIAGIGTGGQGEWDILAASKGNEVVAVCDVDSGMGYKTLQRFPKANDYLRREYRRGWSL